MLDEKITESNEPETLNPKTRNQLPTAYCLLPTAYFSYVRHRRFLFISSSSA